MFAKALYVVANMFALPVWLLGLLAPLAWLLYSAGCHACAACRRAAAASDGAPSLEYVWQLKLHVSSLLLIGAASLVALLLAILAAYAFARLGRTLILWAAAAVLVVPPMVYGYLWYLTVGRHLQLPGLPSPLNLGVPNLPFLGLAAWSIGLWLWPIPALLLSAGWHWTGKPAWQLARMDGSDAAAFTRAALPAMRPYVLACLAICLLLAAQEYAVPALFSVQVWQTQWLALAQAGVPLGQLAVASLPAAAILFACLASLARFWRGIESEGQMDLGTMLMTRRSRWIAWMVLASLLVLTAVLPTIGAIVTMPKGLHFVPGRFAPEFADTPILMVLAATLAVAAALTGRVSCWGRPLFIIAAVAWTLPPSLLAEAAREAQIALFTALPLAIRHAPLDWGRINQSVDLLVWASVLAGRTLPIVWLLLALVTRSLPSALTEQAAADGATRAEILQKILLPILAPALLAGWLICALLVATETASATILRPPGFDALSVSLLNQMHYGRDGDVIATCILMMLVAAAAAGMVAVGLGRFSGKRDIG